MNRRSLETYAVGRRADFRRRSANAFTRNIIAMGDFNLPKAEEGDPIYDALVRRGLRLPVHSTEMAREDRGKDDYFEYVRYHVSDHRLLWAELAV